MKSKITLFCVYFFVQNHRFSGSDENSLYSVSVGFLCASLVIWTYLRSAEVCETSFCTRCLSRTEGKIFVNFFVIYCSLAPSHLPWRSSSSFLVMVLDTKREAQTWHWVGPLCDSINRDGGQRWSTNEVLRGKASYFWSLVFLVMG